MAGETSEHAGKICLPRRGHQALMSHAGAKEASVSRTRTVMRSRCFCLSFLPSSFSLYADRMSLMPVASMKSGSTNAGFSIPRLPYTWLQHHRAILTSSDTHHVQMLHRRQIHVTSNRHAHSSYACGAHLEVLPLLAPVTRHRRCVAQRLQGDIAHHISCWLSTHAPDTTVRAAAPLTLDSASVTWAAAASHLEPHQQPGVGRGYVPYLHYLRPRTHLQYDIPMVNQRMP